MNELDEKTKKSIEESVYKWKSQVNTLVFKATIVATNRILENRDLTLMRIQEVINEGNFEAIMDGNILGNTEPVIRIDLKNNA